jgi:hypothetical protein
LPFATIRRTHRVPPKHRDDNQRSRSGARPEATMQLVGRVPNLDHRWHVSNLRTWGTHVKRSSNHRIGHGINNPRMARLWWVFSNRFFGLVLRFGCRPLSRTERRPLLRILRSRHSHVPVQHSRQRKARRGAAGAARSHPRHGSRVGEPSEAPRREGTPHPSVRLGAGCDEGANAFGYFPRKESNPCARRNAQPYRGSDTGRFWGIGHWDS